MQDIAQETRDKAMALLDTLPPLGRALGLSIDLETPVTMGAGILSIGMVPFDEEKGIIYDNAALYIRMRTAEVIQASGAEGGTMVWWLKQSDEARRELTENQEKAMPYLEGMRLVMDWIKALRSKLFGGNKAMLMPLGNSNRFDIGGIEATALSLGLVQRDEVGNKKLPWNFWDELDLRTREYDCRMFAGKNPRDAVARRGTHHNALDDAIFQAEKFIAGGQLLSRKEVNIVLQSQEKSAEQPQGAAQ